MTDLKRIRIPDPHFILEGESLGGLVADVTIESLEGRHPDWWAFVHLSPSLENPLHEVLRRWWMEEGNRPRTMEAEGSHARVSGRVVVLKMEPIVLRGTGELDVSPT